MTLASGKGPDAFRTISEASTELGVPQHVLRFWETKFAFIRPMKRAGGRRFYRPQDLDVLRGVRALLHEEGYTIKGVQRLHKEKGLRRLVAAAGVEGEAADALAAELESTAGAAEAQSSPAGPAPSPAPAAPPADVDDDEPQTADLFAEPASPAPRIVDHAAVDARELLTAVAIAPEPAPARMARPVLEPSARDRLVLVLRDLETTKAEIDALLGEGEGS